MGTKLSPSNLTCFSLLLVSVISLLHPSTGSTDYYPYYQRQYRILSDPYYYNRLGYTSAYPAPTSYTTYTTHPYVNHYNQQQRYTPAALSRYTTSPVYTTRYSSAPLYTAAPSSSYERPSYAATSSNAIGGYYDDDKVYITDKYGNTRVTTNRQYEREAEYLRQQSARSGKYYRYVDVMTNSYREGSID